MITGHLLVHIAYLSWANKSSLPSPLAYHSHYKQRKDGNTSLSPMLSLSLCPHPALTWSRLLNYLTHNIRATWLSKGWCKPLQGARVCVHVCVLYMSIPGVYMFVPGSSAAGYRGCVGGLSCVCCVKSCWVCLKGTKGWKCCMGITQEGLPVHEPSPICHVYCKK